MSPPRRTFRSGARASTTCLAVVALVLAAPFAHAEPKVELRWTAPAGCPDERAVLGQVERMVTVPPKTPTSATAVVEERDGGFDVTVELHGGAEGKRTLHASTCDSAARGAALVVALAVDPSASLEPPPEPAPSAPKPAPPAPPATRPVPAPPKIPPTPRASEVRVSALAGASFTRALVPGVVPAIAIGARVSWRALRLDVEGELAPRVTTTAAELPEVGATLVIHAFAARPCMLHAFPAIAVGGCVALRGARVQGEGTGVTEAYRDGATVLMLEPGLTVLVPGTTRLGLAVDAAAVVPFTRPELVIANGPANVSLGRVSALGARVGLSASFRF